MLMVATPALLVPSADLATRDIVTLIALFLGGLTFFEYNSVYPGLVEFRDAAPFNRLRFVALFATLFFVSVAHRSMFDPTTASLFVYAVGALIGHTLDFTFSPVQQVMAILPEDAPAHHVHMVRAAAGLAFLTALVVLAAFVAVIRYAQWPTSQGSFNVWINLPTFDPTAGGDIVTRLTRDARLNIALGFVLPFLIPIAGRLASDLFDPSRLETPQTLIWMVALWAFLPTSMFMRGIALTRVAEMITAQRKAGLQNSDAGFVPV